MHWSAKYIGLPHKTGGRTREGLDCWGLFRLIYKDEFGIDLPDIPGISAAKVLLACDVVRQQAEESWTAIAKPEDGCGVAMSQQTIIHHVGVFVEADGGRIIHCWDSHNVIADTFDRLRLKGFRTVEFYRHFLWPSSSKSPTLSTHSETSRSTFIPAGFPSAGG